MKIDFVIQSLGSGGGERVLSILANELAQRGYQIRIITLRNTIEDAFPLHEDIVRVRLQKKIVSNYSITNLLNLFKFYLPRKNRPKIIISFMVDTSMLAIIVSTFFRIKCIASEHTNHILKKKSNLRLITRKYLYRFAKKVVALTEFDRVYYEKHKSDVIVIPNPSTFKSNFTQTKRHKTILAVGNLNKYHIKGFDNLIPIVAEIFKKHEEWKLQIVGSIDDKSYNLLFELVQDHNIENRVVFSGFSNNVSEIMLNSEIFVLTSRFEGLPMVLIEAMSQGMACIAYDCQTGPSDIIDHGKNGVLVKDQDMQMMTNELESLILNNDFRLELRKNAPKSLKKFEPESVVKIWEEVFEQIT